MLLNINSDGELTLEVLADKLENYAVPLVLLREDLKLFAKNRRVSEYVSGLRIGSSFRKRFTYEALNDILVLQPGQCLRTELIKNETCYSVTVSRMKNCYALVLKPFDALKGIDRIYGRLSGYDMNIESPAAEPDSEIFRFSETATLILKMLDELKSVRGMPFFNAAAVVRSVVDTATRRYRKFADSFRLLLNDAELISQGNSRDFALIITLLSAFCMDCSAEKNVTVEAYESQDDGVFRIYSDTDMSAYDISRLIFPDGYSSFENASSLWFHLIKMLSEANLWEFSVEQSVDGFVVFNLRLPLFREGIKDYILEDSAPGFVSEMIGIIFAEFGLAAALERE